MNSDKRKEHWQNIHKTKTIEDVSWYEIKPEMSLKLIINATKTKQDSIIDIGGGDSFLADHLLKLGYTNITVLDISEHAINKAKERLGENSKKINWIVSDITLIEFDRNFDIWHDRAAFHFLTSNNEIDAYKTLMNKHISKNGSLILGSFSDSGPLKCSGISVKQYSKDQLLEFAKPNFTLLEHHNYQHKTPFNSTQNFIFGRFSKDV